MQKEEKMKGLDIYKWFVPLLLYTRSFILIQNLSSLGSAEAPEPGSFTLYAVATVLSANTATANGKVLELVWIYWMSYNDQTVNEMNMKTFNTHKFNSELIMLSWSNKP